MTPTTRPPSSEPEPSVAKRAAEPTSTPGGKVTAPVVKYPLRLVTGPGEESVGKPPTRQLSTPSGGTSGAGDSTRTAGYVADLSKPNVPPPGPPVVIEPTELAGPEAVTPPPKEVPPSKPKRALPGVAKP